MEPSNHICGTQNAQYLICVLCDECFPVILKENHFRFVHPNHKFRDSEYRIVSRDKCCWCPKPNGFKFTVDFRLVEISYHQCSLCHRDDIKYRHRFSHKDNEHPDASEITFTRNFQFRYKCNKCYALFKKLNYNHKCEDIKHCNDKKIENWRDRSNIKSKALNNNYNNWKAGILNRKGFDIILAGI